MQQNLIQKARKGIDTSKLSKNSDLASLKTPADKSDIDESKNIRSASNSLKSKVDKLDVDKQIKG